MNANNRKTLIDYKRSVAEPLLCTDNVKWPIGAGRVVSKCLTELACEVTEDVKEILENEINLADVGTSFINPTRILRMSHHLIRAMKSTKTDKIEIVKTMMFLFDVLTALKNGSIFNDDGYNTILSPDKLSQTIRENNFQETSVQESRELHRLMGLLWTYSEALYFVAHEVCVEIHGIYRHADKSFLVRDYVNLAPHELWSKLSLPYKNIKIIAEYKSSLDLEFDVYDNPISVYGNFVSDLQSFAIKIDSKQGDSNQIGKLIDETKSATLRIIEEVDSWSENKKAKKYVEIFWYRKKPLRDVLGKDWRPPKSIFERIDSEGIPKEKAFPNPPETTYSLLDLL